MTEFRQKRGHALPSHAYPYEQMGYLLSGRIRLLVGTEEWDAQADDSWSIPGGTEHGAEVIEDSVAIEVFSPMRDDDLPRCTINRESDMPPTKDVASGSQDTSGPRIFGPQGVSLSPRCLPPPS